MKKEIFKDNVTIITGASAGIGKQLAIQLAQKGANLSLAARNFDELEKTVSECKAGGAKVIAVPTDVSDKVQCEKLIKKTVTKFGKIDTLINNAGITMWAMFKDIKDITILKNIMKVNYFGSLYCTHFALPYLIASKGRIVAVSSLTGKTGVPTRSGYSASKHAMSGFFDSIRIELSDSGVSVTTVYPGFVATQVRERALGKDGKALGKSPVQESKVMTAQTCAKLIIKVAEKRERELVMTIKGKIGLWLKLISPKLVDRIAKKTIEKGK